MKNDTERLDFLLKYFVIDDYGDEEVCWGTGILSDQLEPDLQVGILTKPGDDIRDIIDRAIAKQKEESDLTYLANISIDAEIRELKDLLDQTPEENMIDRTSLEGRLQKLHKLKENTNHAKHKI